MSCTHDCGCTPEIRDARTDEWVADMLRAALAGPEADTSDTQSTDQEDQ